ncbi:Mediator of RNA polymerase II transcription subunit 6 [Hondaea fermentalgiana]|uniref:Mediator of RNA polymerase II transcription subunit 6 n=1 Tax=Hondaea fermentalgiana TaxID=2315210 RepID=A0A2R5GW25_9STRA|nr:Mediator of RNA polymerase II transcription subunit 6 [Hondaea fermentalgiana]|eukprot:GBG34529.1 Mediator of RNA polymerase II transcription subunit 6 [Hondaea fermentalgiana]
MPRMDSMAQPQAQRQQQKQTPEQDAKADETGGDELAAPPSKNASKKQQQQHQDEELTGEKLAEVSFLDDNWIRAFGLSAHNVLDYFACSPFYDTSCNNEILRMQNLGLEMLADMPPGIEYRLLPSGHEPVLFIVVKQERASKTVVRRQALYYILDKVIYQAPSLQRLIATRLSKSTNHLQNAFDQMVKAARYAPSQGFTWHFDGDAHRAWRQSAEGAAYEARRQRRDEQLERRAGAEIGGLLNAIASKFLPAAPAQAAVSGERPGAPPSRPENARP